MHAFEESSVRTQKRRLLGGGEVGSGVLQAK
jgi:hypothetical protein